jgi:hypothetical protein
MNLNIRFEKTPLTLEKAIKKINARNRKFGFIGKSTVLPAPWKRDMVVGGIYMKDEGWSKVNDCETPPQFWIYVDGRTEVLHVKTSPKKGVEFKKSLAVPTNKKVYRLA